MPVSTEDYIEILDLLARYCFAVDEGDGEGWAALWTEDGVFTGIPDPLAGRDQLRMMPPEFHKMGNGKFRHNIGNVVIDFGPAGTASVKAYSNLINWNEGGSLMGFAKVHFTMVHEDTAWRIKALHADMQS